MPKISYSLKSTKNDLPISPEQLAGRYFFGIPINDPNGNVMTNENIGFHIRAAMESIEGFLNLKLTKQVMEESLGYHINDYKHWGFIPTSFPVLKAGALLGFLGNVQQIEYPREWLSVKKTTDPTGLHRMISLVPNAGSPETNSVAYSGISPHMGWFGRQTIPNYWTVRYVTSFERIPEDILDVIGKLASINIFHQLGDIILGAGIASQSIGIDGLSQSISTTSSATNAGYGARITGYLDDLKLSKPALKEKYGSMTLGIM